MRLSKNILPGALVFPRSYPSASTVDLISNGLIFHIPYRGIPCLTPIGWRVFRYLEKTLIDVAEHYEFYQFQIPSIMGNDDIECGEPIAASFRKKIIKLRPPWSDFHLLVTPEMLLHRFGISSHLSYKNLPIRLCYSSDFFRDMPDTKSFLTCRQFRVFGLLTLETSKQGIDEADQLGRQIMNDSAGRFGIELDHRRTETGFETAYRANGNWGRGGPSLAHDVMPIAMGYHYGLNTRLPLRFRTADNKNGASQIYTFGLSLYRLLFALFDAHRDGRGFALAAPLRPFDVSVIPTRQSDNGLADELRDALAGDDLRVAVDDRYAMSGSDRVLFGGYIGAPVALRIRDGNIGIVGRNDQANETAVARGAIIEAVRSLIRRHDG